MSGGRDIHRGRPLSIHVPDDLSSIRADLQRFFDAMVHKLHRNRKKGRWEGLELTASLRKLREEVDELEEAIIHGNTVEILLEAADVANWGLICANIGLEARHVQLPRENASSSSTVERSTEAD